MSTTEDSQLINFYHTSLEIKNIILATVLQMMTDRELSYENKQYIYDKDDLCVINGNNKQYLLKLVYIKLSSIKESVIENIISNNVKNYMFFVFMQNEIPQKIISQLSVYNNVEIFTGAFLMFPVVKHDLVPQHIKLTKQEGEQMLHERNISASQLKRILITDPVSMYYNYKIGDIIRIIRPSLLSGKNIDYRIVVSG